MGDSTTSMNRLVRMARNDAPNEELDYIDFNLLVSTCSDGLFTCLLLFMMKLERKWWETKRYYMKLISIKNRFQVLHMTIWESLEKFYLCSHVSSARSYHMISNAFKRIKSWFYQNFPWTCHKSEWNQGNFWMFVFFSLPSYYWYCGCFRHGRIFIAKTSLICVWNTTLNFIWSRCLNWNDVKLKCQTTIRYFSFVF